MSQKPHTDKPTFQAMPTKGDTEATHKTLEFLKFRYFALIPAILAAIFIWPYVSQWRTDLSAVGPRAAPQTVTVVFNCPTISHERHYCDIAAHPPFMDVPGSEEPGYFCWSRLPQPGDYEQETKFKEISRRIPWAELSAFVAKFPAGDKPKVEFVRLIPLKGNQTEPVGYRLAEDCPPPAI